MVETMETVLQGPNWPLIAKLRPQLRKHARIYPQVYRGERWYILRDESSGRHLRVSASAYEFIGRLDGKSRSGPPFEYKICPPGKVEGDAFQFLNLYSPSHPQSGLLGSCNAPIFGRSP